MPFNIKKSGFRVRIFISTTLLVILLAIILTGALTYQQTQTLKKHLQEHGYALVHNFAKDSTLTVLMENPDADEGVFDNLQRDRDFVFANIYNQQGESIVSSKVINQPLLAPNQQIIANIKSNGALLTEAVVEGDSVYLFWAPVMAGHSDTREDLYLAYLDQEYIEVEEFIGFVEIVLSQKRINQQVQEAIIASVSVLLVFFPVSFLLSYWIARRLSTPLNHLVTLTKTVADGDLSQRIDNHYQDETAQLATSFNTMIDSVKLRNDALKAAHDELEQRVELRTKELSTANTQMKNEIFERLRAEQELELKARDLGRRNDDLEKFAYAAAHDLKTPLRGIANVVEWLKEDLGEQLDETSREHLNLLRKRVLRLESLIEGLREYAMAGDFSAPEEHIDCAQLIQEIIESYSLDSSCIIIDNNMPVFSGHRKKLSQVFSHLISNALEHAPIENLLIKISMQDESERYRFCVHDNGPGIDPAYHKKVFDMFETIQRKDHLDGVGIGLAVVKKIVEEHRGEVTIDSSPHQGTNIYFTWPKVLQTSSN